MKYSDREFVYDKAMVLSEMLNDICSILLEMLDDIDNKVALSRKASAIEAKADYVFHEFSYYVYGLDLDEDELYRYYHMVRHVEDCIDLLDDLCKAIVRYNVTKVTEGLSASINTIAGAAKKELSLVIELRAFSDCDGIIKATNEFDTFKVEYMRLYDMLIADLFTNNTDAIDVLRWKEIYDAIKEVFEAFEVSADDCYKYVMYAQQNEFVAPSSGEEGAE